jgi:signal transduction histidine kinase
LSTIKWFLEILINGNLGKMTPKQEEVLKKIERSNQRMISLINSLLDISRIDSGKLEVNRQLTDMRILIREVIHDLESQLEENKQTIRIKIPSRLPEIFLDPQLIRQVFMNLLTNAIKYSPAGSTIKLTVVLKDGSLLCRIEDQGVGIPEHQQERVFEKFFRGENAAKLTVNGNGLGLYMVKKLIESSGGVIGFNSGGQKGSEFWFKLPVAN